MRFFLGTAGWTVPKQHLTLFSSLAEDAKPSHLQRYASRLACAEINSSFHRPHRRATWERWAAATPDHFRFAVKAPKTVTHMAKLINTGGLLLEFFDAVRGLGEKLGPVLVQLPPKLTFDEGVAREFFTTVRELHLGAVVLEPRHLSWFSVSVDRLLRSFEIARVAADPPKGSELAARPGGWQGLAYWRLHGAPRTYYSEYDEQWLQAFARRLTSLEDASAAKETWVILITLPWVTPPPTRSGWMVLWAKECIQLNGDPVFLISPNTDGLTQSPSREERTGLTLSRNLSSKNIAFAPSGMRSHGCSSLIISFELLARGERARLEWDGQSSTVDGHRSANGC